MADYTTMAAIKARIPITSTNTADDTFLLSLISRASNMIDEHTHNHFTANTQQTRMFDLPYRNPRRLLLDDWLLPSTTPVVTNGNGVVIPTTEYVLEDYNNPPYCAICLKRVSSYFFMPDLQFNDKKCIAVLGDWGFSTIPDYTIVEACERLVVQMYRGRSGENMSGSTIITPAGVIQTPKGFPPDVMELLSDYVKTSLSFGIGYAL